MEIQKLYGKVRKAIDDYKMIEDGDRIAVGLSGGKDSLALLYALAGLRDFYPHRFELIAITVDLGYEDFDTKAVIDTCEELKVEHFIVKTDIAKMTENKGCGLCCRLRKGALLNKAAEEGCNKIAYGHNRDDVVETMMLSLIYEGRFCSFWPVTDYEDTGICIIRPLIYVEGKEIKGFTNKYNIKTTFNPCPFDGKSERTYVRELLDEINRHAPDVRKRMMTAVVNSSDDAWKIKRD